MDFIIKNRKGNDVRLKADKTKNHIILSKKNDRSPESQKRRVKVYVIDNKKFEEFQNVEVTPQERKSILGNFFERMSIFR